MVALLCYSLNLSSLLCIYSECVEILLMHGATVVVHDAVMRRTPLHAAGEEMPTALHNHFALLLPTTDTYLLHTFFQYPRHIPRTLESFNKRRFWTRTVRQPEVNRTVNVLTHHSPSPPPPSAAATPAIIRQL
jgi:hypothetical protein